MTRLQRITELSQQTMKKMVSTPENWGAFLKTAAWNYKYSIQDQLLIYAQQPDATACATLDVWNQKVGRWVNKGAKSIALLDDTGDQLRLRYVFDVKDTNGGRGQYDRPLMLWTMQEQYHNSVIETLENVTGELLHKGGFTDALVSAAYNVAEDNVADYLDDIMAHWGDSLMDGMDEQSAETLLLKVLGHSVAYMLLTRCGYDARLYIDTEDLREVTNFNTPAMAVRLGSAVQEITDPLMREIAATVKELYRAEKEKNRTVVENPSAEDNQATKENERSHHHGSNIPTTRGLSSARTIVDTAGSPPHWEIRNVEKILPQKPQEGAVRRIDDDGPANPTFNRSRPDSESTGRTDRAGDGSSDGRGRNDEKQRAYEMDEPDELPETHSGGNDFPGTDLQLTLFPTVEEQQERIIQAEEETSSAIFMPISQEEINLVLTNYHLGTRDAKLRIALYLENHTAKESAEYIKRQYSLSGRSHTFTDGAHGHIWFDGKGMTITRYGKNRQQEELRLSWSKVQKHIRALRDAGQYLTDEELSQMEELRETEPQSEPAVERTEEPKRYALSPGTKVLIGTQEYEIESAANGMVVLCDVAFPLLRKELEQEALESLLRENPFNDHLAVPLPAIPFEQAQAQPESENITPSPSTQEQNATLEQQEHSTTMPIESEMLKHEDTPIFIGNKENFRISPNDTLDEGGKKAKYHANAEAICTLKKIERESRSATLEEQEILSKYVGWGGLSEAFDENNTAWKKEYTELCDLLSPEEYEAARATTLNAHYTTPVVIQAMYDTVARMGFTRGNILEPSCGVGRFFGLLPDSMKEAKLYGVEIDNLTGRIAQQLYPKANIAIQGYEQTDLPDSFFDLAIGNIPFGGFGVWDKKYDKHHWLIHDYFIGKTLDKMRPGGVIAFITSKGTLDKQNSAVRKYIAQRAELLGAVRLPNNAFYKSAGTQVTADILFLQKRDRQIDIEPDWVYLGQTAEGIPINAYFAQHPEMVLGTMAYETMMYGHQDTTCHPIPDANLAEQLANATAHIHADIEEYDLDEIIETDQSIPADPNVRNFSFAVVDSAIYYRENSRMNPVDVSATTANRIKGMIEIRDCLRRLIEYQIEDYSEEAIHQQQAQLNTLYDRYTAKYGILNKRGNKLAFQDDASYYLLSALEVLDAEGNLLRKADIFSKRTIRKNVDVTHADTPSEALTLSMSEHGKVDLPYMSELTGQLQDQLIEALTGIIYRDFGDLDPATINPETFTMDDYPFVTAEEYLSGFVRKKLVQARELYQICMHQENKALAEKIKVQVDALEKVQPVKLTASDIGVRLGTTWIPYDVIKSFMEELLEMSVRAKHTIQVHFTEFTGQWSISGKSTDRNNILANTTYGTERVSAYRLIEDALNLRNTRIYDAKIDATGKKVYVLNAKQTRLAQQKQQLIKQKFVDWLWADPERRHRLEELYNDRFNGFRPRTYDGSHLRFPGMNPEIHLLPHQVNAIARILYSGNTLLAHVVGAGKTWEMVAACMKSRQLGLVQKPLFVVPNHLIEQWASEFLELYPSANLLVSTPKDFEAKNRKRFCSRIATGEYDAVIIGHSQYEKIPISPDRQKQLIQNQIEEITEGIRELKSKGGERFSVKQLERTKKAMMLRLQRLNDQSKKDTVVTFEETGIDQQYIDEAHYYKNLFLATKMTRVAGLATTDAQKSSDLFAKCRYLDELTNNRGTIMATGTPVSNSMTELYTLQRYLQYDLLRETQLVHFDAWASSFGETITALELSPEGTGYRMKTRFARFFNLPELMSMFRQVADIQTADMLDLPRPKVHFHNVSVKPSEFQSQMIQGFVERAEQIRQGSVDPSIDNMLKITNDGRKLALEQRLLNPLLPDFEGSKVNACVDNVFRIWEQTKQQRSTQLIFCDLSTPAANSSITMQKNENGVYEMTPGQFSNVYEDIRAKLIRRGIPPEEIAFIHDAGTDLQKKTLFTKVREGSVRVLIGSTTKMGAGTNVQKHLIASHDLDCPWRPSDLEQRLGRMERRGNENPEVHSYRYVTETSFDAYLYQLIESKQRFISQIMTSKSPMRVAEDIDEVSLSYEEIKMLAVGDPRIKERMDLEMEVSQLRLLKSNHLNTRYMLEDRLAKFYPKEIARLQEYIQNYEADIQMRNQCTQRGKNKDGKTVFSLMILPGQYCTEKEMAGKALLETCKGRKNTKPVEIGSYRGFTMALSFEPFTAAYRLELKGALTHQVTLGTDVYGNIARIDNALEALEGQLQEVRDQLQDTLKQKEHAEREVTKPFAQEQELQEKSDRLAELDALLELDRDRSEDDMIDDPEQAPEITTPQKDYER